MDWTVQSPQEDWQCILQVVHNLRIHDVFHISLLKAFEGACDEDFSVLPQVESQLPLFDHVVTTTQGTNGILYLVHYQGTTSEDDEWVTLTQLLQLKRQLQQRRGRR